MGLRRSLAAVALAAVALAEWSAGAGTPRAPGARPPASRDRAIRGASEMVLVPGGVFGMGLDDTEAADALEACRRELRGAIAAQICDFTYPRLGLGPAQTGALLRRVSIRSFWLDRREVTSREYRACVAAQACDPRPLVTGERGYIKDEWPVVNVTWYDAQDYCRFRGKRLPTEAEWEKAARGPEGRRWPWGDTDRADGGNRGQIEDEDLQLPTAQYVSFTTDADDGAKLLARPGSYPWGKSPYGIEDLAGNVSEWVSDWFSDKGYDALPVVDPTGPEAGHYAEKVSRGGSFYEPRLFARTYYRGHEAPATRAFYRGFRCARD